MKSKPLLPPTLRAAMSWAIAWGIFALAAHSQALGPVQSSTNGPAYMPGELLIKFKVGATDAQLQDVARRAGVSTLRYLQTQAMQDRGDQGITLAATPQPVEAALQALKNHPAIEYAQPNWVYQHQTVVANDPSYFNGSLWGMYGANPTESTSYYNEFGIAAEAGWDGPGNSTVYVGIIDEGIQYNHPDLGLNIWRNPGEISGRSGRDDDGDGYIDDIYGWNAINNNGTIYNATYDDHGTHVAGTIGAVANNGTGVVGVTGNKNVKFIAGKFLGPTGGTTADAIEIIDYMIALKTHKGLNLVALNNSWGGGGYDPSLLAAIVRAADADILFVVAAGNDGLNTDATPAYPACYNTTAASGYNSVISVTAIDKLGAIATWANYGANTITLGAPGVDILSTLNGSKYGSYSGTSMATPHVTGAIALYKAKYPNATAADIRAALVNSAIPTDSLASKTSTHGRLNVATLLQPPATVMPNAPSGLVINDPADITATSLTLHWSDTSNNESSFKINRWITDSVSGAVSSPTTLNVGTDVSAYTDTGLIPGTLYTYTIQACNNVGCAPTSPTPDTTATATTGYIARAVATFKSLDTTTQGSWVGTYGAEGYDIISTKYVPPSGMTLTSAGLINIWAATTTDVRGLQSPNSSSRTARCYYSPPPTPPDTTGNSFTLDVNLTDGKAHKVSLYCLDWDSTVSSGWRGQTIEIIDYNYKAPIAGVGIDGNGTTVELPKDSGLVSFYGGQYLTWEIQGHVTIKVTNISAANSVVSGIFIDAASPATAVPNSPIGLTAAVISKSQVNLVWMDQSPDESVFIIERSTTSATSGFTEIARVAANSKSYSNTGLNRGTTYYYRVGASNENGISYSTSVTAATPLR